MEAAAMPPRRAAVKQDSALYRNGTIPRTARPPLPAPKDRRSPHWAIEKRPLMDNEILEGGPIAASRGAGAMVSHPAIAPLSGRIAVPGDKSISHRALMFGALAIGET